MARYPIPKARVRVEHRQSNSRFIATLDRAGSVEEARAVIRSIREEMPDATHHVYAMKVGFGASVTEGMSDDGEPGGTSGPPALAVLRGAGIGDAVLVITRYYGGTKLGTGGLVAAYSEAAKLAVAAVETIEKVDRAPLAMTFAYPLYRRIHAALQARGALFDAEDFAGDVTLLVRLPAEELAAAREEITGLASGQVVFHSET